MITRKADSGTESDELRLIRQALARKAGQFRRTGAIHDDGERRALYPHRHQIKPTRDERRWIFAALRYEEAPGVKSRRRELGWFWFRHAPRPALGELCMELAQTQHPGVRWPALNLLTYIPSRKSFALLRKLGHDADGDLAAEAVRGLGRFPAKEALPLLRRMSIGDTESARREAVWAVAGFGRAEDVAFLRERTGDESRAVRTVAAMALTQLMGRDDLARWLEHDSHRMSFEALVEVDFALYCPRWLATAEPRVGDDDINIAVGLGQPELAAQRPAKAPLPSA